MLDKIEKLIDNNKQEKRVQYKCVNPVFRTEKYKELYWSYYPFFAQYYFEANPTYSFEYRTIEDLARYSIVMLRDGFLSLASFFLHNPRPPEYFLTTILIPKKYESLVPKSWIGHVACYQIKHKRKEIKPSENLILFGSALNENNLGKKALLPDDVLKAISSKNVYCFCPTRKSLLAEEEESFKGLHTDLVASVAGINSDAKFFENFDSFGAAIKKIGRSQFFHLDQSELVSHDHFFNHYLLADGHTPFMDLQTDESPSGKSLQYDLSLNHYVEVTELMHVESIFPEILMDFKMEKTAKREIYDLFKMKSIQSSYLKYFN